MLQPPAPHSTSSAPQLVTRPLIHKPQPTRAQPHIEGQPRPCGQCWGRGSPRCPSNPGEPPMLPGALRSLWGVREPPYQHCRQHGQACDHKRPLLDPAPRPGGDRAELAEGAGLPTPIPGLSPPPVAATAPSLKKSPQSSVKSSRAGGTLLGPPPHSWLSCLGSSLEDKLSLCHSASVHPSASVSSEPQGFPPTATSRDGAGAGVFSSRDCEGSGQAHGSPGRFHSPKREPGTSGPWTVGHGKTDSRTSSVTAGETEAGREGIHSKPQGR